MMTQEAVPRRAVLVRVDSGEDLLGAIRGAVERAAIQSGVFVAGAGSLNRYRFHVVDTPDLPVRDRFLQGEEPVDILGINGYVLGGRVHAHVTVSRGEHAFGGHLEEGCRVLTFAIVTVMEMAAGSLAGWDRVGTLEPGG